MVQAEHDSVEDSVTVNQVVLSIRRCMFGHQSLSCQRPIRRYRLDLVEEILSMIGEIKRNSLNLNHWASGQVHLSTPGDPISKHSASKSRVSVKKNRYIIFFSTLNY